MSDNQHIEWESGVQRELNISFRRGIGQAAIEFKLFDEDGHCVPIEPVIINEGDILEVSDEHGLMYRATWDKEEYLVPFNRISSMRECK